MRKSEATVDAVAEALARFEDCTGQRDFGAFHFEQAIAFKRALKERPTGRTGKPVSTATAYAILGHLRRFFRWLPLQTGYRRLKSSDADYFNPSEKDARAATARRIQPYPTLEQMKSVIRLMPFETAVERRDRAVVALMLLTGARDGAVASLRLKHIDVVDGRLDQDARDVNTKNSKTFPTFFLPIGDEVREIICEWVGELRRSGFTDDDPLFPATLMALSRQSNHFEPRGLSQQHWRTTQPIRNIFRAAFERTGLPYFNPHTVRKTLVMLGETLCRTPEEFNAWSQNIGHENVLTTFTSYGPVQPSRQAEIISELRSTTSEAPTISKEVLLEAVESALRSVTARTSRPL
jgi:integrase